MDAVTELASEVGASAAQGSVLASRFFTIGFAVRLLFPRRPGRGLYRHAHSVRRNANRSWLISPETLPG